ncbi:serine hydrolase [Clostridium nigeriense]|uniref:serine hydrolase n=1 Tax=Clostridium nigeriense TaxID=1805470 RepID=UPI003D346785
MKKIYILFILSLLSIFLVGCKSKEVVSIYENGSDEEIIEIQEDKDENTEEEEDEEAIDLVEAISKNVDEILGEYKNNVSIYFKNLNTNEEYILNGDTYYVAASTTKVPLCMMILDDVNNGSKTMNDLLYFTEADREGGSGSLYYLDEVPNLTIGEAIYLSIVDSDNIAKNMLSRVASSNVTDYMRDVTDDYNIPYGNYTTANQFGELLRILYENPDNNPYYSTLIDYMTETNYHDRLDKYLDYGIVAHKIGNYYRYYHDVGIIYGADPYILVVLTKDIGDLSDESFEDGGEDERFVLDWGDEACEIIAQISKEIYTLVDESKK